MPENSNPVYGVGEFQNRNFRDGIDLDTDNGFVYGPEKETVYVAPIISNNPGEIWEMYVTATLSTEPTDDITILRVVDETGDPIARDVIGDFGGNKLSVKVVFESEQVNGDVDVELEAIGSDSYNYFVNAQSVRLRRKTDTSSMVTGDNFTST